MSMYGPTRDPDHQRRRLINKLQSAVAAGITAKPEALAYLQDDASKKTGVTAEKWNPETIKALTGTREVDTAR